MRTLLVNPWVSDFTEVGYWTKPIGLLYVGSFLSERGHSVDLVDCMDHAQDGRGWELTSSNPLPNRPAKIRSEIVATPTVLEGFKFPYRRHGIPVELFEALVLEKPKPDVVIVTSVMTYWYHGVFEAISSLKKLLPNVPIVLGGVYARLCTEHAEAESGADAVIPESLPSRIIEAIESLVGDAGRGPIVSDHFCDWPEPCWDLYEELPIAVTMTSKGCPMRCTCCASNMLSNGYTRRSPADSVASIQDLADRGVKEVGFMDEALLVDAKKYAIPMFRELARRGQPVRLKTPNGLHVSSITNEVAESMYEAGVDALVLSIETISKARMESFSRKTTKGQFATAVRKLLQVGYQPNQIFAYLLFGLPGQEIEEALETREFVRDLGVEPRALVFAPVPGTVEFQRAVESGMLEPNADPALHNNKVRALAYFESNPDKRAEFRELFGIGLANSPSIV